MWFTEDPWPPIVLCGLLAAVFAFLWSGNRRGVYLAAAFGLCLAAGGIYFLERSIVTERERVEAAVYELCSAFQKKDAPAVLNFFSANDLVDRLLVDQAIKRVTVKDDLRVSDVHVTMKAADSRAISHFRANATISVDGFGEVGYQPFRCELTWQREGGAWKIIKVTRLDPLSGKELSVWSSGS
jgi:hypothetical protein